MIITLFNKVKYPYNISAATQLLVLKALNNVEWVNQHIILTITEREKLRKELQQLPDTETVYPSDANFLLVKMKDARKKYDLLCKKGIIVRDRSRVVLCENSLRITVGTPDENKLLIESLKSISHE